MDGKPYLLSITDTAGQEEYRSLWAASNLRADAFILVYDITSPSSLHEQLPMFAGMIAAEADRRHDVGDVPPVTIVVGNKCDLSANRKVTAKTGWEWSRSWGWGFMETSARDCVNVEETFTRESHLAPGHGDYPSRLIARSILRPSFEFEKQADDHSTYSSCQRSSPTPCAPSVEKTAHAPHQLSND